MRLHRAAGQVISLGLGAVVILAFIAYMILGLLWWLAPYRTLHCPLGVNSRIQQHSGSIVSIVIDWITWPMDKLAVERQAEERGVPVEQIRFERYCPHN